MTSAYAGTPLLIVTHENVHLSIVKQKGDWGDAYQKKAAMVRLAKADLERMGLKDGARVEISTAAGSVVVMAKSDATCEAGLGFMPASLYTNRLAVFDPGYLVSPGKYIQARVTATEKAVTPVSDLIVRRSRA
jgi:formylmethanofuran dehydrogenase subunit D